MAEEAQVDCYGINGCKGQGWKTMSITDCKVAGGNAN
jgi:hypothetical protein